MNLPKVWKFVSACDYSWVGTWVPGDQALEIKLTIVMFFVKQQKGGWR